MSASPPAPFLPLAESPPWARQRAVYEELGQRAWSEGIVAWRATTGPLLAELEAGLVAAFAEDARAVGWLGEGEPLTVWDVGAGTGRLSFHLVPELERLGVKVELVLTDVALANVEAWRAHPQLAPWIAAGRVRTALFDALKDEWPRDVPSGRALEVHGPVVVAAHYLFDTLPHEAWRLRGGQTLEGLTDGVDWIWRDGAPPDAFASFLAGEPESTQLVPVGALDALGLWARRTHGRLCVLAVDKGAPRRTADEAPLIAHHGSVSAGVNFPALASAWSQHGIMLGPTTPSVLLSLNAFTTRALPVFEMAWAARAASNPLERFFSRLPEAAQGGVEAMRTVIDESHDDPDVLAQFAPALRAQVPALTVEQRQDWAGVVARCADRHFVFRQQLDVPFELATLAHALGALRMAVRLYALALGESGAKAATLFQLACASKDLGDGAQALEALEVLLSVVPDHPRARVLREAWLAEG